MFVEIDRVLTVGQVARIVQCAPRSVSKWIDSGMLPGYRLPCSKARRVKLPELVRFMQKHGVPVPPSLLAEISQVKPTPQ